MEMNIYHIIVPIDESLEHTLSYRDFKKEL